MYWMLCGSWLTENPIAGDCEDKFLGGMDMAGNIKRLVAIYVVLAACLSSCDDNPNGVSHAVTSPAKQQDTEFSITKPRPLELGVTALPLKHGAKISGQTNLPDGTQLMLKLGRASVFSSGTVSVMDGEFSQDLYPSNGEPIPPGDYEVEISTPLGDVQPAEVKAQLGANYEALTGPLLIAGAFGRTIEHRSKIQIGGTASPESDRLARKQAYKDHVEFSERSCQSNPDTVERLSGQLMSPERRAASIRRCIKEMDNSRKELIAQGLVEP